MSRINRPPTNDDVEDRVVMVGVGFSGPVAYLTTSAGSRGLLPLVWVAAAHLESHSSKSNRIKLGTQNEDVLSSC